MTPPRQEPPPVSGPAVYEFQVTGTVGPLTRAAIPGFDMVAIPRFTILTGRCRGPDELQRLLTALDDNGSPATAVRVNPGNGPTVDPGAINWAVRPEGTGVT
jgi:hypothetical protein